MGANQSHQIPPATEKSNGGRGSNKRSEEDEDDDSPIFPNPTGHEYDAIDKLQAELPSIIDDESQQQVDDYKEACNGGKGPVRFFFVNASGNYDYTDDEDVVVCISIVSCPHWIPSVSDLCACVCSDGCLFCHRRVFEHVRTETHGSLPLVRKRMFSAITRQIAQRERSGRHQGVPTGMFQLGQDAHDRQGTSTGGPKTCLRNL